MAFNAPRRHGSTDRCVHVRQPWLRWLPGLALKSGRLRVVAARRQDRTTRMVCADTVPRVGSPQAAVSTRNHNTRNIFLCWTCRLQAPIVVDACRCTGCHLRDSPRTSLVPIVYAIPWNGHGTRLSVCPRWNGNQSCICSTTSARETSHGLDWSLSSSLQPLNDRTALFTVVGVFQHLGSGLNPRIVSASDVFLGRCRGSDCLDPGGRVHAADCCRTVYLDSSFFFTIVLSNLGWFCVPELT